MYIIIDREKALKVHTPHMHSVKDTNTKGTKGVQLRMQPQRQSTFKYPFFQRLYLYFSERLLFLPFPPPFQYTSPASLIFSNKASAFLKAHRSHRNLIMYPERWWSHLISSKSNTTSQCSPAQVSYYTSERVRERGAVICKDTE